MSSCVRPMSWLPGASPSRRRSARLPLPGSKNRHAMLAGQIALILAAAFTGAAFYVGFAEHPARMGLDDRNALKQWKPSYDAGYVMQATLAAASAVLGLFAAWST